MIDEYFMQMKNKLTTSKEGRTYNFYDDEWNYFITTILGVL